jgi:hypothetical protein
MRLAVVELGQIFEVIWVGLLAGVGITTAYSFVVLGSGGYAEARRTGRSGLGWAALAAFAFVVFIAGMVIGVKIMLSK